MPTIINGSNGKTYQVLDRAGNNYLLRDAVNGHYVIALGFRDYTKGWDQGKYFCDNKDLALVTFSLYNKANSYGYK